MKNILYLILLLPITLSSQNLYFPPISGQAWEEITPQSLNWNVGEIDSLLTYLDENNTKAFIVLKDGKIAIEAYFDDFTQDSNWYWASAGKTLCAFMVGLAQEDGYLDISDTTTNYLGQGWTGMAPELEEQITIYHQLSMTSGLNDQLPDKDCTDPDCLQYIADPGDRWAYHNAPYTLIQDVVEEATGQIFNIYLQSRLRNRIGMNGTFIPVGFNKVFFSTARSMTRFGLLMQAEGRWNTDQIMADETYYTDQFNTSNDLNQSYGYLWWLNGKSSFMVPTLQTVFPGSLFPDAPADMYAALGLNGQLIHVAPSEGIVLIRMGDAPNDSGGAVSLELTTEIWKRFNKVIDTSTSIHEPNTPASFKLSPNPVESEFYIHGTSGTYLIMNQSGRVVKHLENLENQPINIHHLPAGTYFVKHLGSNEVEKLIKY